MRTDLRDDVEVGLSAGVSGLSAVRMAPSAQAAQTAQTAPTATAATAVAPASPCINICRMQPSGLCEGCLRTIDEIAAWSQMSDEDKRAVWVALERRRTLPTGSATGKDGAAP